MDVHEPLAKRRQPAFFLTFRGNALAGFFPSLSSRDRAQPSRRVSSFRLGLIREFLSPDVSEEIR